MATEFQKSVWESLTLIPSGKVTTYGRIARHLGNAGAVRAVATAVGKNPNAPEVPCHRVVPSSGKIGKYTGPGGVDTKIKLLSSEGVSVEGGMVHDFESKLFEF